MAIYMNFNNKAPKGNVTADGYEDWIELSGMNFGVGRGISMEPGAVANREATRPSLSEFTISKPMCAASGGLFSQSVTGSSGVKVIIHVVKTGGDKLEKYAVYTLENVLVSSYSVSASSNGSPQETVSLSYARIEANLSHADLTNKNPKNALVGYDLTTAKPL